MIVSLIFLIAITLVSLSAVRSSVTEMKIAGNQESLNHIFQTTQAAIDQIYTSPTTNLPLVGIINVPMDVRVNLVNANGALFTTPLADPDKSSALSSRIADCLPPPRLYKATSSKAFSSSSFKADVRLDDTVNGNGTAEIAQGYLELTAKCS